MYYPITFNYEIEISTNKLKIKGCEESKIIWKNKAFIKEDDTSKDLKDRKIEDSIKLCECHLEKDQDSNKGVLV